MEDNLIINDFLPRDKNIPYDQCYEHIAEGDVLLFRSVGIISNVIKAFGRGDYSHSALASWNFDKSILECVEFREFYGGRVTNLKNIALKNVTIDVYRPSPTFVKINTNFENDTIQFTEKVYKYDGRQITNFVRRLAGRPYGWRHICSILKNKIPVFAAMTVDNYRNNDLYWICSTVIAEAFYRYYIDLMPNKPNILVEPSDIGRSPVLNYLFTIKEENNV